MATISQSQSGRTHGQESDGRQWGHKKNASSQDSRHNFSYPTSYSQSPPPQSPTLQDEYHYDSRATEPSSSGFDFHDTTSQTALSDRAVNRYDNPRARQNNAHSKINGSGDSYMQPKVSRNGPGGHTDKGNNSKQSFAFDDDQSKWIHRDKLTAIEIQEHIALGKEVPAELLRKMEQRQRNEQNRAHKPNRALDYESSDLQDNKKQRLATPSPDAESYEDDEPFVPEDPRSPEEIAADAELEGPPSMYQQQRLRSSSSRIPLSTSSPLPVPQEHLDRNTRIPRKRGASGTYEEDTIAYPKSRSRSHSVTSQVLLDDDVTISNPGSPSKAKAPTKGTPAGRKGSNLRAASGPKSRATSSAKNSPAGRPTTRDGRPTTAVNRPEGDPPWLATMYKPDPRLPPDQQIIPTHAKRMMQEQWEREGKPGQVYDREFRPVALYPEDESRSPSKSVGLGLKPEDGQQGQWPSRGSSRAGTPEPQRLQLSPQITKGSLKGPQSPIKSPQMNGEGHGGYSTVPKVQSTPIIGSTSPKAGNQERFDVEEQNEKGPKSKGCGCCIVM